MRGATNETRRQGGIDWRLWLRGTILPGGGLIFSLLSRSETFEHGRLHEQRPLLLVVTVLAVSAIVYFLAALRSGLELLGITGEYELALGGALYGFELSGIVARSVCALLIGGIVILLAMRSRFDEEAGVFLSSWFHALAALLLLGPLGSPWYFTWCIPLLPFVRYRSWLLLPCFLMVYSLGFWYEYRIDDESLAERFADRDLLVSFGLFYLCLGFEWWREKRAGRDGEEEQESLCDA